MTTSSNPSQHGAIRLKPAEQELHLGEVFRAMAVEREAQGRFEMSPLRS